MSLVATDERVNQVWYWCVEAYAQNGRKLAFPQGTDPTKTYPWRYARYLADQIAAWDLSDADARQLVRVAVAYAKERGLLKKGLALLCQGNLLQVCYSRLLTEHTAGCERLDGLRVTRRWYMETVADQPHRLLTRAHPDADCAMLNWYRRRNLSALYMSLSSSCYQALEQLRVTERDQLPNWSQLYLIRLDLLKDQATAVEARTILGGDWKQCL